MRSVQDWRLCKRSAYEHRRKLQEAVGSTVQRAYPHAVVLVEHRGAARLVLGLLPCEVCTQLGKLCLKQGHLFARLRVCGTRAGGLVAQLPRLFAAVLRLLLHVLVDLAQARPVRVLHAGRASGSAALVPNAQVEQLHAHF